ncbi:MAG: Gfo/Idh/MocA family oxidoreductase [Anaerolineales bacterium]|nr:Gfo/Idh/MocA family oxidoreductase [Anaerolineales bacterium]
MSAPIPFGIVGNAWRAEFYLRIAQLCPDQFTVTGITARDETRRAALEQQWGIPAYPDAETMLRHTSPAFVVTSVPWAVNPGIMRLLAERDMPILSETPPAPDIETLKKVWQLSREGARIQVAEQYHLQPLHAARIAIAQSGLLGDISQAQVSAAHGYHGISLMRRLLGLTFEEVTISGHQFTASLVAGPTRAGLPEAEAIKPSTQDIFYFEFGDKLAVFDFTGDQYFSWIRNERILVRGERGEIINENVTYLADYQTPISLSLQRHTAGRGGNLEGFSLRGIQLGDKWVYENPFFPARLADDEIAVAGCLTGMARYLATGEDFYSLAEAAQDHYLNIIAYQALAENRPLHAPTMPWAEEAGKATD